MGVLGAKRLLRWLRTIVSLTAMAILIGAYDFGRIVSTLTQARPSLVLMSVVLFCASIAAAVLKWRMVLPAVRQSTIARAYLGSFFYALLPAGQLGGEASKLALAVDERIPARTIAASIAFDKVTALSALTVIGAVALTLSSDPVGWRLAYVLGGTSVALLIGLATVPSMLTAMVSTWRLRPFGIALISVAEAVAFLACDRKLMARSVVAGLVSQGLMIATNVAVAKALSLSVGLPELVGVLVLTSVAALVPISVAGIGIREVGVVALLGRYGIPGEASLAYSLTCLALFLTAAMVGMILQLVPAIIGTDMRA